MDATAAKALVSAQTQMGKVLKNAKNPHLKSKYADLGSVMDACLPALHENGFAVMQPSGSDEHGPFVDTVFLHESGETFRSRIHLVLGKSDMQALGSAQTYARRYGLLGMAGLAPEDDDGEATKRVAEPQRERQAAREPAPEPDAPPLDVAAVKAWLMRQVDKPETMDALDKVLAHESYRSRLSSLYDGGATEAAKEVVAAAQAKRASFESGPDAFERTFLEGAR